MSKDFSGHVPTDDDPKRDRFAEQVDQAITAVRDVPVFTPKRLYTAEVFRLLVAIETKLDRMLDSLSCECGFPKRKGWVHYRPAAGKPCRPYADLPGSREFKRAMYGLVASCVIGGAVLVWLLLLLGKVVFG